MFCAPCFHYFDHVNHILRCKRSYFFSGFKSATSRPHCLLMDHFDHPGAAALDVRGAMLKPIQHDQHSLRNPRKKSNLAVPEFPEPGPNAEIDVHRPPRFHPLGQIDRDKFYGAQNVCDTHRDVIGRLRATRSQADLAARLMDSASSHQECWWGSVSGWAVAEPCVLLSSIQLIGSVLGQNESPRVVIAKPYFRCAVEILPHRRHGRIPTRCLGGTDLTSTGAAAKVTHTERLAGSDAVLTGEQDSVRQAKNEQ